MKLFKIKNASDNCQVGRRRKKNSRGTVLVLECAICFEGRKVLGVDCIAGLKSLPGPWILLGLGTVNAQIGQRAGRGPRLPADALGRRRGRAGSSATWCAPGRRAAGRQRAQGGGAVCTMAYPGHPGAGGGYYPGGVSAARAGRGPGRTLDTNDTERPRWGPVSGRLPGASHPRLLPAGRPTQTLPFAPFSGSFGSVPSSAGCILTQGARPVTLGCVA